MKPIATCDFPGVGVRSRPLPPTPLDQCMFWENKEGMIGVGQSDFLQVGLRGSVLDKFHIRE